MRATAAGTESLSDDADLAEVGYTRTTRAGLVISRLGFGTYRVDERSAEHGKALQAALLRGVNLIDTSTNYTDGSSERAVGAALRAVAEKVPREGVVVVSKAGYLQGSALADARERPEPWPEVVELNENLAHCLHPEFLSEQLTRSLGRMGLQAIDAYLLHNPEYFLSDAARRGVPLAEARATFDDRVKRAFARLEEERTAGRITFYGVSSNTFGAPPEHREATSLARMLELAREVGGREHGFAFAQLPQNLLEPAATSALQTAVAEGVSVLVNRPLNAFRKDKLERLAEPAPPPPDARPLADAADEVEAIEAIFVQDFAPRIQVQGQGPRPAELFQYGRELARAPDRVAGLEHWLVLQAQVIGPQVNGILQRLDQGFGDDPGFAAWARRYAGSLGELLKAVTAELTRRELARVSRVKAQLASHVPPAWQAASLSRQAIGALLSTPGVSSVLVGMRRVRYVDDALGAVGLPPLDARAAKTLYEVLA